MNKKCVDLGPETGRADKQQRTRRAELGATLGRATSRLGSGSYLEVVRTWKWFAV